MEAFYSDRVYTVKDVNAATFIEALAKHLKKINKISIPAYTIFYKTAVNKEHTPYDPDFIYTRAAAMARRIYIRPEVGLGAFAKIFGGKGRRGALPNKFQKAARSLIRHLLQEFQKLGWVEISENGGRRLTAAGRRELDTVAVQTSH